MTESYQGNIPEQSPIIYQRDDVIGMIRNLVDGENTASNVAELIQGWVDQQIRNAETEGSHEAKIQAMIDVTMIYHDAGFGGSIYRKEHLIPELLKIKVYADEAGCDFTSRRIGRMVQSLQDLES